jgi:hypothetical protein
MAKGKMAYSFTKYTGNGSQTNWSIDFPFLDRDHVLATVNGASQSFTWINDGLIQISPAIASGAKLKIYRQTPDDALVDFVNNAVLSEEDLDTAKLQSMYLALEAVDRASESIGLTGADVWDAQSKRIINLGAPDGDNDAVRKADLNAVVVAAGNVPSPVSGDAGAVLEATAASAFAWRFPSNEIGQCRLTKSGANLLLSRHNGRRLFINGQFETIPEAGVTLAPTGLTPNTTYYIYAEMVAGVMTLVANGSAPTTDATHGHKVQTGNTARTLVGMARIITGPAWVDTITQRFVLSYFNRRNVTGTASVASANTTSTSYVELSTSLRVEFLAWGDESVHYGAAGTASNNTSSQTAGVKLAVDNVAVGPECKAHSDNAAFTRSFGPTHVALETEGYHYLTLMGAVSANTMTVTNTNTNVLTRG